ncbi:cellular nucleic acid-binding protein, partial [Trifolium medium]|nr:cellular nucleic acid-binding protein [Trifolium medium]
MDRFLRNRPPTFKGKFDPDGAQEWLDEIERIFRDMTSTDPQKVRLATHMLAGDVEHWWRNIRQRMEAAGTPITWMASRNEFL